MADQRPLFYKSEVPGALSVLDYLINTNAHHANAQHTSMLPPLPPDVGLYTPPADENEPAEIWRRGSAFIENILISLEIRMQKQANPAKPFITRDNLAEIWSTEPLEKFVEVHQPFLVSDIEMVKSDFLQTLLILVEIRWSDWPRFKQVFLEHRDSEGERDRTDKCIPDYTRELLEADDFLGGTWGSLFFRNQFIFCPIDIEEGMSLEKSPEWRLPFLDEGSTPIARGGHGSVTKEFVAPGHLRFQPGSADRKNVFACKRFASKGYFDRETRNLRALRDSMSEQDGILPFFATVTIGTEFNLLFKLADMDLETFLYGDSTNMYLGDLISEAANLAGALGFLHEKLEPPLLFCYMDLKPANILVFCDSNSPNVGKWKISDFGISIIAVPEGLSERNGRGDTFGQTPSPIQGTYQSPEVCNGNTFGRKSDVWSLGCILVQVLVFALDGAQKFRILDEKRRKPRDGITDYDHDYFHRGLPPTLNPHIEGWLNELLNRRYPEPLLQTCGSFRELLRWTLKINIIHRPSAMQVWEELKNINQIIQCEPMVLCPPSERSHTSSGPRTIAQIPASSLVNAIKNKCTDLETLLSLSTPVDVEGDVEGDRPLIHAIQLGSSRAVDILLNCRSGLDIETPSRAGNTPLLLATEKGNEEIVGRLLREHVNVNIPSRDGFTPLMKAARHGHNKIVSLLLDHGADCEASTNSGYNSLHYATFPTSGGELIRLFIGKVPNFNITQHLNRETPLISLVQNYQRSSACKGKLDALISAGANINLAASNKMTPLAYAVCSRDTELADELIKRGAQYGDTPYPQNMSPKMKQVLRKLEPPQPLKSRRRSLTRTFRRKS